MESLLVNFLQIAAVMLPFVILILGFAGYLYYRNAIKSFKNALRKCSGELRSLGRMISNVQTRAQQFSQEEPEPYGPLTLKLNLELVDLELKLRNLFDWYRQAQEQKNRLGRLVLKDIFEFPVLFSEFKVSVNRLDKGIEALKRRIDGVYELDKQLQDAGWVIAQQCQDLLKKIQEASVEIDEIAKTNMGDPQSEANGESLKQWESTLLSQIPAVFFSGDRRLFDEKSDRKLVVAVYKTFKPAQQETTPIFQRLASWRDDLQRYQTTLGNLIRKNSDLNQLKNNLSDDPAFPVDWDESHQEVEKLNQTIQVEQNAARKISDLAADNRRLAGLVKHQSKIYANVVSIAKDHNQVRNMGDKERLAKLLTWTRNAVNVVEGAKRYPPDNWREGIRVGQVYSQLESLSTQMGDALAGLSAKRIKESQIPKISALLARVNRDYDAGLLLYNEFYKQLQAISVAERESKEKLTSLQAVMKQVQAVVQSNPLIQRKAGKTIDRIFSEIIQSVEELDRPEQGSVYKKSLRVTALTQSVEKTLNKWTAALTENLSERKDNLSKTVNLLQDLVTLSDPIFVEVVSLLQERESTVPISTSQSARMPLLSIAQELKSKSEAWQKVIAANQAVEEITGPVLNEFDKLEKNRRNLQTQIGRADQIVPEKLAWPPTTQRLTMERDKFKKLEEQYNSFKKTRHKAIQLVSIISDLSDQYRELHGEVTRILDQASQDQKRFTDLERRLHQSKAMWNSRLAENRTNAILVDEIEELLENIDRDYQELQKRVMSGSLPFQQALQMFRVLCRKLDEAAVQAGANQIMDITGQIHRQL